ncbi:MAG: putative peptidoglycan glycosyltransferase FtsW [Pseudomonadota bacterium]|nr:putative peptidoglycan glycosyltransferase FtsW [Pseudomonadota bacterium]MEC9235569.1 putative peptidoglycan glycosyltransferase FtsW [Pseudomonadota bacterium]MED5423729.1 putative peptidoglycan glycosyltransferase FtsW [Pseudomonadota bacterium]
MSLLPERTDQSLIGRWWWTVDHVLLLGILALMVVGVILVTAAGTAVALRINLPDMHFIIKHLVYLVPSVGLMFMVSLCSPRMVWRLGSLFFMGVIFALILVPFIGPEIKGAQRWISLPGFSLQPSEFAKPAFAVVAAWLLARWKEDPRFKGPQYVAGLYMLTLFLFLIQPDFGMSFVLTVMLAAMVVVVGLSLRYVLALLPVGAVMVAGAYSFFPHVRSRIDRFLAPESGDSYQVDKSLEAFRSGGLFGKGPGQGDVKLEIPDSHADFIFSVGAEEFGLIFIFLVIGLYIFILIRALKNLQECENLFSIICVSGILAMFALQAMIHMGSSLGVLPAKGMTLPFLSYGGSSLLAMSLSMGVVLALTRREPKQSVAKKGLTAWRKGS